MKRICFVSMFDLTRVQHAVAARLETSGHQTCWITTNPRWSAWLRQHGVQEERICQLAYSTEQLRRIPDADRVRAQIASAEAACPISVNLALQADQFVMAKQRQDANDFMLLYYRDIKQFLQRNNVEVVIAEPTNSSDLMVYVICCELGIPYLFPQSLRFPDKRFFFGSGVVPERLVAPRELSDEQIDGHEILNSFRKTKARPSYFTTNNAQAVVSPSAARRAATNRLAAPASGSDLHWLTHHDTTERIAYTIRRLVNGIVLTKFKRYPALENVVGRIAFFGLHVQPENSIDVQGPYYSDQLKLIRDIRRALPFDTTLVVKEHPNRLGSRPLSFYRELSRIPNVTLVSHDVSTFDIYDRAEIVFTVAGTTAYEAGMLGVPAVVFSSIYFDQLSTVFSCRNILELPHLIQRIRSGVKQDIDHDAGVMASLVANSFSGYWTDPLTDPAVLADDNLRALTNGFEAVLRHAPVAQHQ